MSEHQRLCIRERLASRQKAGYFRLLLIMLFSSLIVACGAQERKENAVSETQTTGVLDETTNGPAVLLEVFPVFLSGKGPVVLIPSDKGSWTFPLLRSGHAHILVQNKLASITLKPEVIHSTSWRQDKENLLLTYLAIVQNPGEIPEGFNAVPVRQSGIVRGGAASPPPDIPTEAVINHAFQHLAWLYQTDASVREALMGSWKKELQPFQPKPAMSFE